MRVMDIKDHIDAFFGWGIHKQCKEDRRDATAAAWLETDRRRKALLGKHLWLYQVCKWSFVPLGALIVLNFEAVTALPGPWDGVVIGAAFAPTAATFLLDLLLTWVDVTE